MSRQVRRVPLDFEWPMDKVWEGFLLPENLHETACPNAECRNGQTTAGAWLASMAYMILMLGEDVRTQELGRPMHPYFHDVPTQGYGTRPSADILELTSGLAGRAPGFLGHDAIDSWRAFRKIRKAAGLPKTWGICATCTGHGSVESWPGQRQAADEWEPTPPPEGEGWQIWESVSEGSPVTPVFATPEGLAGHWAALHGGSPESVLRWITSSGWAPSGIIDARGVHTSDDMIAGGGL